MEVGITGDPGARMYTFDPLHAVQVGVSGKTCSRSNGIYVPHAVRLDAADASSVRRL